MPIVSFRMPLCNIKMLNKSARKKIVNETVKAVIASELVRTVIYYCSSNCECYRLAFLD